MSDFFQNFEFLVAFFEFQIFKIIFGILQLLSLYKKDRSEKMIKKMQSNFFRNFDFSGSFFKFQIFNIFFSHFTAYIII